MLDLTPIGSRTGFSLTGELAGAEGVVVCDPQPAGLQQRATGKFGKRTPHQARAARMAAMKVRAVAVRAGQF